MRHFYVLWALVVLLAGATTFAIVQVENVQHHQNDALSAVICHAEKLVRQSKGLTPEQRQRALRFYDQQIKQEHLRPCQ